MNLGHVVIKGIDTDRDHITMTLPLGHASPIRVILFNGISNVIVCFVLICLIYQLNIGVCHIRNVVFT